MIWRAREVQSPLDAVGSKSDRAQQVYELFQLGRLAPLLVARAVYGGWTVSQGLRRPSLFPSFVPFPVVLRARGVITRYGCFASYPCCK